MKKILINGIVLVVIVSSMFLLTGCTLQIETSDNSVSASVDGDTTEKVDSVLDWIKARISRLFNSSDSTSTTVTTTSEKI